MHPWKRIDTMKRFAVSVAVASATLLIAGCAKEEAQTAAAAESPAAAAPAAPATPVSNVESELPLVTVYKDPNCGCCSKWVDHMKAAGFEVKTIDTPDVAEVKKEHGIGPALQSCHTALVGAYALEGHVPADDVKKLLAEKPTVAGLAVPGMPMGSPGMEGATKERYEVLTFDRAGKTTVFAQR
jgi:hypothetical protein